MDQAEALKAIDALGPASPAGRSALVSLVQGGGSGADLMERLDESIAAPLSRTAADIGVLLAHAQTAWTVDQRDPEAGRTRDSARQLISLVPDLADGYRLLAFAHLSRGEYLDAYLALSALKTAQNPPNFDNFHALARHLMIGVNQVSFDLAGERYTFDLTTHNAAAIESSAFHSVGALTEWDELQYLGSLLQKPQRIVEIGVLLGNHTAYFLKNFAPRHVTLIDADPANINFMRRSAAFNLAEGPAPEVVIQCAYVGGGTTDAVTFANERVPHRSLADLVSDPVDFLKIDVDGGEVGLLAGAASVIETHRPAVMIETTPTTFEPVKTWFTERRYDMRKVFDHGSYRNVVLTPA
jgi:FkbM family methyltransferase